MCTWRMGLSCLILLVLPALGTAAEAELVKHVEGLRSEQKEARESSLTKLRIERLGLERKLVDLLGTASRADHSYGTTLHCVIWACGEWRIEGAVPGLLAIVDFQLARGSFPFGGRVDPGSYFPAAEALARIGGNLALSGLLRGVGGPDERVATVCLWALCEITGDGIAVGVIDGAVEREKDAEAKARLAKAKHLIPERVLLLHKLVEGAKP